MTEQEAKRLEVNITWNGSANVCVHCGNVPETYYIVTGHDHTDDEIRWCPCRDTVSELDQLREENAKLREELAALKVKPLHYEYETVVKMHKEWVDEIVKLREELAEAKRVTFDPVVLEKMNLLEKQRDELLAALEKFIDSHEECTDFDGYTAQIVVMDDYHEAQEVLANIKDLK